MQRFLPSTAIIMLNNSLLNFIKPKMLLTKYHFSGFVKGSILYIFLIINSKLSEEGPFKVERMVILPTKSTNARPGSYRIIEEK